MIKLTIPKNMITLTLTKDGKLFVVDDLKNPGSPPVGRGRTMKEALGDWLINNQDRVKCGIDTSAVTETIKRQQQQELKKK